MKITPLLCTLTAGMLLTAMSACRSQAGDTDDAAQADEVVRRHNLTLLGYNYTDFEIASFEVNGQGGGNIEVSYESSGAHGRVCCVTVFSPMHAARPVTIRWNPVGDKWCEQTVMLAPNLPAQPENFEVHFYQDGRIEVAVSEGMGSDARLRLPRKHGNSRHQDEAQNVDNSATHARCQIGYP